MRLRYGLLAAFGFLLVYGSCLAWIHPYSLSVSYCFQIAAVLTTLGMLTWRTRRSDAPARLVWALLTAGILLWSLGLGLSAWEDLGMHASPDFAEFSDFLYFLFGVPILLALSLPARWRENIGYAWLDALQSAITACVIYLALFSSLPFPRGTHTGISSTLLARTYNVENPLLAIAATFRLVTERARGERKSFYLLLTLFLWAYVLCTFLYNRQVLAIGEQTGLWDLLVPLPFLVLALGALQAPVAAACQESSESVLPRLMDGVAPALYTFALLALGVFVVRSHFYWGAASLIVALGSFVARSLLLQNRLLRSEQALRAAHSRLEAIAMTDGLTGIANRRCFDKRLSEEWNRARRSHAPLSLLLIDIDYFKALNDRLGHIAGDHCLVRVAGALHGTLRRETDLLARYGGEEFGVLLADTSAAGAEAVAARMQAAIRALDAPNATAIGPYLSVSIGISTCETPLEDQAAGLLDAADRALYLAKANGRNRIEALPYEPVPTR